MDDFWNLPDGFDLHPLTFHSDTRRPKLAYARAGIRPDDMKGTVQRSGQGAVVAASLEGHSRIEDAFILRCVGTGGNAKIKLLRRIAREVGRGRKNVGKITRAARFSTGIPLWRRTLPSNPTFSDACRSWRV